MNVISELKGSINEPADQRRVGNLDSEKFGTNEQRVIPIGCGQVFAPALWIGQVFDQYTVDAPVERPGKK